MKPCFAGCQEACFIGQANEEGVVSARLTPMKSASQGRKRHFMGQVAEQISFTARRGWISGDWRGFVDRGLLKSEEKRKK